MSTQILIKRSTTTGAIPTTSDIAVGELAINTVDKRIFTNNSGTIVELGTTPTTQAVTGNASVGGTFDVVGAVTVGNLTADGTVDLTSATVTIPAPTADTHPATKKYVDDEVNAILDGAPAALDTLNEIAAAINDDANLYTTLTTSIATKLSLAGGTMTGSIDMGANSVTTSADPATDNTLTRKSYVDGLYQSTVDAEVSAAAALASEQAAATSATNSATSASASATQASAASTSATNAASSATAAASSATSSANSATASATSATQSAASATQAQALVDSIEVYYLGAESSAPTTDDNGDPLQAGAWYFNTTDDNTYIYNGSSWQTVSPDLVADVTPQLGGNLDTNGNDITFGDSDKAIFGAGSDLQIYHDGSDSRISDVGTGNLVIQGSTDLVLKGTSGFYFVGTNGAEAELYYNNAKKLSTTSTGIDVTGTATMDGLTVDGNTNNAQYADLSSSGLRSLRLSSFANNGNDNAGHDINASSSLGAVTLSTGGNTRFKADSNGDISFYEDTGTTAKFFWDASAESLGIGTSSPAAALHVDAGGGYSILRLGGTGASDWVHFGKDASDNAYIYSQNETQLWSGGSERVTIDSSGNVGIGITSMSEGLLHVKKDGAGDVELLTLENSTGTGGKATLTLKTTSTDATKSAQIKAERTGGSGQTALEFYTFNGSSTAERMRIDSSGNVGIGTSSPDAKTVITTSGNDGLVVNTGTSGGKRIYLGATGDIPTLGTTTNDQLKFITNGTEAMRIDSSGNLLVGQSTQTDPAGANVSGLCFNADGYTSVSRTGTPMNVNRRTTDGDIVKFSKDGSTVGSIGIASSGNDFFIAGTQNSYPLGIVFGNSSGSTTRALIPCNGVGARIDNKADLGTSSYRWDDIYATNGTIQTSDEREKQDIDVLSEAEQRVAVACKGLLRKFRWKDAVAEKGDDARIHFGIIAQDLKAAFEAEGLDASDYAMFIHTTWWEHSVEVPAVAEELDEEGNVVVEGKEAYTRTDTYDTAEEAPEGAVERDRMGVRYPELLAFIIASI
jgi:hypothetical protein